MLFLSRQKFWVLLVLAASLAGNASAQMSAEPSKPGAKGNIFTPKLKLEDWTTPSLQGSQLVAGEPLVGEVDDNDPDFTRELTRVRWRGGDPVDLYIVKPKGIKKPPVILYLYGYPADTDRFLDPLWCREVTRNGFAAVGFVSALTGVRYRGRPMKEWFVSELQESLASSAHDVQMILNYLATRRDVNGDRVAMFGEGSGATIAILAAGVDPRIKTLDLLNPWGDWPDWIAKSPRVPLNERPDFLKPEFLAKAAPLDPVKWLPQLTTQKIRLQEVMSIRLTPNEAKEKIIAAAPANAQVVRYDTFSEFQQASTAGKALDWIKEQVQANPGQDYGAQGNTPKKGTRQQAQ